MPVTAPAVSLPAVTLADAFPTKRLPRALADMILIVGASLFVAAAAQVSIPLPFTPVPITGQTFAVLMTGLLLGSRRAALALALYLLEGTFGLPFFAGGAGGYVKLLGPTGGYLWSYPVAAFLTGLLAERGWERRPHGAALAMALGSLIVLTCGSLWLSFFVGGVAQGFQKGMLPFLPGDSVKIALAATLLPLGWRMVRRFEG